MPGATIAENLEGIRKRIEQAAVRSARRPGDIKLIAVSKQVDIDSLRQAIEAGLTVFGESYIQEARTKIRQINAPVRWDFIGHLQRNKAGHAADLFELIHSVDSPALAREINRAAMNQGKKARVLIEVNISGEKTKSGIAPEGISSLLQAIASLPHLSVEGLMTMAPYSDDPETSRPCFRALRQLRDEVNAQYRAGLQLRELSMGMSSDFEVAIEEGATLIRIGTAIFGERA